jgi:hypothetical protein
MKSFFGHLIIYTPYLLTTLVLSCTLFGDMNFFLASIALSIGVGAWQDL